MKKATLINRRNLSKALLAGTVLPLASNAERIYKAAGQTNSTQKPFTYSKATKNFIKMFGLEYPIVQAPAGGVVSADFVATVSNTGCLGGMPLSWSGEAGATAAVEKIKQQTIGQFFVNFVLTFEPVALKAALIAGAKIVQFSWGMPTKAQATLIKSHGASMGIQVTSKESAVTALELGADYLVCQGTEAGGHVHASRSLPDALAEVLSVSKNTPVIASGGIASGQSIRKYLDMGAAGVVMGTRFVATQECAAHQTYKQSLVEAKKEDTVFTTCMNKGWDNGTHRILRNSTFKMWEASGCAKVGSRPGEHDKVAQYNKDAPIDRYSITSPGAQITGDIEALANYAGKGVSHITDIPTVEVMIKRLWKAVKA